MKNFKELDKRDYSVVEREILESWGGINKITERQIENRKNDDYFVFYDGPAFANGFPGLHHMVAKNLKDAICKYKAMKGYKVVRKVGWDTHGLPVENHVEKKLGISSKKEIETIIKLPVIGEIPLATKHEVEDKIIKNSKSTAYEMVDDTIGISNDTEKNIERGED